MSRTILATAFVCIGLQLPAAASAADLSASLDWSGRVALAMPVSGVVDQVMVHAGQRVKQGQVLASLNATVFKALVEEARAEAERQIEEEAEAKRDLDRVKELYARTVATTTELDAAKLRQARAGAALAGAQARLAKARRQLDETELRAPFDAVILSRIAEPGMVAATPCQPNPLLVIARDGELVAQASLDAAQANRVRLGSKAEVEVAGRGLKGEVRALTALDTGKYRIEVVVPRQNNLMAGQSTLIRLP